MENMEITPATLRQAFKGKKVLVTGHTGFKGSWLSLCLKELGATVIGYALKPDENPNLFDQLQLSKDVESYFDDVRDASRVQHVMAAIKPDVVFHLAAQPLVRYSYQEPLVTFDTNVMGTANVLEAVRRVGSVRVCQIITTDKCYENVESEKPYVETDRLGGRDPYSASKACAEIVVSSYRDSFLAPEKFDAHRVSLSSVRAGNVIGGGDWTADRIIPDCVRALQKNKPIVVRNPNSIRPWQHVLEPLFGYLTLGAHQLMQPEKFAEAWNFGPDEDSVTVSEIVDQVIKSWGAGEWQRAPIDQNAPHESKLLNLDCSKAKRRLGWSPLFSTRESVSRTIDWYKACSVNGQFDARAFTMAQIQLYLKKMAERTSSTLGAP